MKPVGTFNKNDYFAASFKAESYSLRVTPEPTSFSRRDFYKIWLISSKGVLHLPDQRICVDKPALIFLNPLVVYKFEPTEDIRTGYWCIFTKEFLVDSDRSDLAKNTTIFEAPSNGVFFPGHQAQTVISFLFEQILIDFNSTYPLKYQSIKDKISLLIHEGNKLRPANAKGSQHNAAARIVQQFFNLLEEQFPVSAPGQPVKLRKPGDFANELAVHVNHLNAVVQELTSKTTSDHITLRMLSESKALLRFSDWSVADIAYGLGFDYPNHFAAFFKKHSGITPLQFRN